MLVSNVARNVIYKFIKKLYYEELTKKQRDYLSDNEVVNIVNNLYGLKKNEVETKIRLKINKKISEEDMPSKRDIDRIINDIFNDEDLAKNRVRIEIRMYQKTKMRKNRLVETTL